MLRNIANIKTRISKDRGYGMLPNISSDCDLVMGKGILCQQRLISSSSCRNAKKYVGSSKSSEYRRVTQRRKMGLDCEGRIRY